MPANTAPVLTGFSPSVTFNENTVNAAPQVIDGSVAFADPDDNFSGGRLTVTGLLAQDRIGIWNEGTGAGQIGVAGASVSYGGTVIGTFAGGSGAAFTVTFNASATSAAVDALIEHLTYANFSDIPTPARDLRLNVIDAAGADLGAAAGTSTFTDVSGTAQNPFSGLNVGTYSAPAFVDLDNDGDLDLVAGNGTGTLRAFRNNGVGAAFTELTGVANPFAAINTGGGDATPAFLDLDGDGDRDLVLGRLSTYTLMAYRNDGPGTAFVAMTGAPVPIDGVTQSFGTPAAVDFDNDGDLDLVVGDGSYNLRTFRNDGQTFVELNGGNIHFGFVTTTGVIASPSFGDLDGDGDLDLVVGDDDGNVRAYRNNGVGMAWTELAGGSNPLPALGLARFRPSFFDIDGDGDGDVVYGKDQGPLAVLRNDSARGQALAVNVTPVNDPPVLRDNSRPPVGEDVNFPVSGDFLRFRDPERSSGDTTTFASTIIVTLPTRGTLFYQGVPVVAGQEYALAVPFFTYLAAPNENGVNYASFTYRLRDTGGTANGGSDLSAVFTYQIDVLAFNDAPAGTDGTIAVGATGTRALTVADFGFTDPNDPTAGHTLLGVTISTLPTAGTLTFNGATFAAGIGFSAADIAAGKLVYTPGANASGAAYATFTFQVRDTGGTSVEPSLERDTDQSPNTLTVAINNPPSATNLNAAENYTEDTPLDLTDIVASDGDSATLTARLTLSNPAAGALGTATSGGVTSSYDAGTGVWTATGATAAVNALLAGVTFNPTRDFNGGFTVATSISDGVSASVTGSKAFTGTAVPDAPSGANRTITLAEDGAYTLSDTDFGFSDPDGDTLSLVRIVSLPGAGQLSLYGSGISAGLGIGPDDIAGAALVYRPAANANGTGYASFTFAVADSSGQEEAGVHTITFNVTAVNDAPVLAGAGGTASYTAGGAAVAVAGGITVADVDNSALTGATAVISSGFATGDRLNFAGQNGITGSYSAGTLTLAGAATLADYQAALRSITFESASGTAGNRTISFRANDGAALGTAVTATVGVAASVGAVSVANAAVTEGDSGTAALTFTIARSGGTAAFSLTYRTADGTATVADGDYAGVATAQTLNFAANEDSKTVTVTVTGDSRLEADETLSLILESVSGNGTFAGGGASLSATGTITNDDAAPAPTPTPTPGPAPTPAPTPAPIPTSTTVGGTIFVSNGSYTQPADSPQTVLSTQNNAGTDPVNLTGNAGTQTIVGNNGGNVLDSGGGLDTLFGLGGNDTFVVTGGELVVEAGGGGTDTVLLKVGNNPAPFPTDPNLQASAAPLPPVNYALAPDASVEVFAVQDPNSTGAANLTGSIFSQTITGNNGANILNGFGGNDTMVGLGGNDTYLVRGSGDVVVEGNGGGSDTVFTTVSYNLGVNEVEVLSTVTNGETTPIDLIGNFATQLVIGNYGNNVLNGGSGGVDTLIGLRGDDIYAVGDRRTGIVESAGEGSDTVVVSVDYTLGAGVSVEVLAAQNRAGTGSLVLKGNEFAQTIAGTEGANTIDGGGGNDVLIGGGGADSFRFTTAPGPNNVDSIVDFQVGVDKIGLSDTVFAGLSGGITAASFGTGSAATTPEQRILYNSGTGQLFYDADGSGAGAAVLFAVVTPGLALTSASFELVPGIQIA